MPDRISVIEQYNNRDLIAQIYRIISLTESSTIVRVSTVQEGSHVTVTLEMYDGTSKTFEFDCVGDVTTDTDQSINALKHFMMGIGITGPTHIDGDVRIVNGHYLQLAGDLNVGGDTELAGDLVVHGQSEISGMSFEESSGKTVISNDLGISTPSPFEVPTTITGARDAYAANGERVQNDLDSYVPMLRTTGNQGKRGILTLYESIPLQTDDIDRSVVNPSQVIGKAYRGTDKNGKNLFSIRATRPANTREGRLQISCYTENANAEEKNGYLDLLVNEEGKITLRVYSPYSRSFHELYKDV
jgi:hypothetical protein